MVSSTTEDYQMSGTKDHFYPRLVVDGLGTFVHTVGYENITGQKNAEHSFRVLVATYGATKETMECLGFHRI